MKTKEENPYFIFDGLLELRDHAGDLDAADLRRLKERIALNAADPAAASALANLTGDDWLSLYPAADSLRRPDTGSAIETFLNTFGSQNASETAQLEKLIFNPTPDYATTLAMQEEERGGSPAAPATAQDAMLDAFIASHPDGTAFAVEAAEAAAVEAAEAAAAGTVTGTGEAGTVIGRARPITVTSTAPAAPTALAGGAAAPAPVAPVSSSLQESLAKSYIRQGRYQKAFDIISELNLNNPEKSAYFADQLRFLQKIIHIQQAREARKG
ncbi:MAG: hypothetical protein ACI30P_03335 [Muribaculaceae bacterium]